MNHPIFGVPLYYLEHLNETIFLSSSHNIINNVISWEYNRPSDITRIEEIRNYIKSLNHVDGIIYVAEQMDQTKNFRYTCFDGNHRLQALKQLDNYNIIVHVLWSCSNQKIKDRFVHLNKANPVPEIYTLESNQINGSIDKIKTVIQEVVSRLCYEFPKFQSTSKNPRKPNFNRDKLVDLLLNYITNNNLFDLEIETLWETILKTNEQYKNNQHINLNNYNQRILNKCNKFGCYLFLKTDFTEDI